MSFLKHFKAVYLFPKDLDSKKFPPAVAWPYHPMGQQLMGMQQQQKIAMALEMAMLMQQHGMATAMPM
jgi:hypothetical protein